MPESELKVSCRFQATLDLPREADAVDEEADALRLAGVGGDRIESLREARLAEEAGLDMFARTSLDSSRTSVAKFISIVLRVLCAPERAEGLTGRRACDLDPDSFAERRFEGRWRRTASLSYEFCVAVKLPLDPLDVVKLEKRDCSDALGKLPSCC